MTSEKLKKKTVPVIFAVLCAVCIVLRDTLRNSILLGIKLSVNSIIPTLFPFFVISDFISKNSDHNDSSILGDLFERIFKIGKAGLIPFLLGNICGFPLGVKYASELYGNGQISKGECTTLSGISNNPSFAFCISVVGAVFLGNALHGLVLYITVFISTVITGLIFSFKRQKTKYSAFNKRQKFVISNSIRDAGTSSLCVASFIIFFSGVTGIIERLVKCKGLFLISALLLEVGGGTAALSGSVLYSKSLTFALFGFALGFSGLSVHLQAFAFLPEDISKRKYLLMKLTEGAIAFIISYILSFFVI